MKKMIIAVTLSLLGTFVSATSASAGSWCNNGTYSSNSGRGTCSWNGGVNRNFSSFSDPGSSSFNRNNGFGSTRNYNSGTSLNNGFGLSKRCPAFRVC